MSLGCRRRADEIRVVIWAIKRKQEFDSLYHLHCGRCHLASSDLPLTALTSSILHGDSVGEEFAVSELCRVKLRKLLRLTWNQTWATREEKKEK